MNNEEHPFSEQAGWRESWILFTLLLLFSSSGVIRAVEGDTVRTFSNPVFKGADPWVYKTDSCYYYCFVYKKGLAVSKTKELHKKWATCKKFGRLRQKDGTGVVFGLPNCIMCVESGTFIMRPVSLDLLIYISVLVYSRQ